MNAYTEINGEPMASSAKFLKELIRDEMGWNGMMVTDWSEIRNQHDWHKVAETPIDAVEISMRETTIDMSMVPNTMRAWQVRSERHLCHSDIWPLSGLIFGSNVCQPDGMGPITSAANSFITDMKTLSAAGKVSQRRMNVGAGRVLQLKEDLGLLDDPMLDSSR